ncbi:hypothetical protein [Brevibacillus sp. SAFN-007a]|uniref:hypothetical protein n=1 Tax=Brevibacillus sp. SAFN-007a TaxID=3436862 RepID=UPI003F7D79C4
MRLDELQFSVEEHAYKRYCQRVEPVTREALLSLIGDQLQPGHYRQKGYLQLDGVWWRYSITNTVITLHTCYGRHHIDLPAAIRWAKQHRDRIVLGDLYGD